MKPIIMSTEDVRGILAGRKTMFRLVAKELDGVDILNCRHVDGDIQEPKGYPIGHVSLTERCKFKPGDVLYVRETWACMRDVNTGEESYFFAATQLDKDTVETTYLCDDEGFETDRRFPWKPSIFMPKKIARLFLRVKDVRVERVQDIRFTDALSEGVKPDFTEYDGRLEHPVIALANAISAQSSALVAFKTYWDSRNVKRGYSWDSNPFVWVIEFERVEKGEES